MRNNACRILLSLGLSASTLTVFADNAVGIESVSGAADSISSYMPAVRVLCFSIAAVIAIVGAYYGYYQIQQGQETKKVMLITVGSALAFCVMAVGLPKFFGYDDPGAFSSMIAENSGGVPGYDGGSSSLSSDVQGVPSGTIDASIPDMDNPAWQEASVSSGTQIPASTEALIYKWMSYGHGGDADLYMNEIISAVNTIGFDQAYSNYLGEYTFALQEYTGGFTDTYDFIPESKLNALRILETAYKYPYMLQDMLPS